MKPPTQAELEAAYADCVKRRGREVALDILQVMGGTSDLAAVPENRRFLTEAALSRRPPTAESRSAAAAATAPGEVQAWSLHEALARIGADAFARMRDVAAK